MFNSAEDFLFDVKSILIAKQREVNYLTQHIENNRSPGYVCLDSIHKHDPILAETIKRHMKIQLRMAQNIVQYLQNKIEQEEGEKDEEE